MRRKRAAVRIGKALAVALILAWSLVPIVFILVSAFKPSADIFAVPPRLTFAPHGEALRRSLDAVARLFRGPSQQRDRHRGRDASRRRREHHGGLCVFPLSQPRNGRLGAVPRRRPPAAADRDHPAVVSRGQLAAAQRHPLRAHHPLRNFFVSLGTLLMRTFIDQIPRELDEAALVDGASRFAILRRVIMPLSAQGMLAVAVFVIVFAWNEFLFAFIFTSTRAKTAPLFVAEMMGSLDSFDWGVLFAAATVQLLPIMLFVLFAQKHLVAGLTGGAIKG
jgi:multiple sugar transport system permease protein